MDSNKDLELIIKSRIPLIVIDTNEESRIISMLVRMVINLGKPLFKWTVTEGLQRMDLDLPPQKHNADPANVLGHIKSANQEGIYILVDFHPYLSDPMHVRLIKDIAINYDKTACTLILLSHNIDLPDELRRYSATFKPSLPGRYELIKIVHDIADEWKKSNRGRRIKADNNAYELLINNLGGLTAADVRRLARNAIYDDGAITHSDIPELMQTKYKLLNKEGILSYEYDTARFADVGGLKRLKHWLKNRKAVLQEKPDTAYLDKPKGILLLGVQGCGKSLAAKAAAGIFGVPLLRLDFGALYNKYYGETERNLRESLQAAEVMAPCVLWMDEIEKGLAVQDSDDGVSRRVLGTLLTWMAEKEALVFIVATANDITALPPELVRKGRFDEIFFVDLPSVKIRADIFSIHLKKRKQQLDRFDIQKLAKASDGFSGAEIEQSIVSAMYSAHARNQSLVTDHILQEIRQTRPLSVLMAEQIEALRAWARDRTVPSD